MQLDFKSFTAADAVRTFANLTGFIFHPTVPGQLLARSGVRKIPPVVTPARYSAKNWEKLWASMLALAQSRQAYDSSLQLKVCECPTSLSDRSCVSDSSEIASGRHATFPASPAFVDDWDLDTYDAEIGLRAVVRSVGSASCVISWFEGLDSCVRDEFWIDLQTTVGSSRIVFIGEPQFRSLSMAVAGALNDVKSGERSISHREQHATVRLVKVAGLADEYSCTIRRIAPGSWIVAENPTFTVRGQYETWLPRLSLNHDGLQALSDTLNAATSDLDESESEWRSSVFLGPARAITPDSQNVDQLRKASADLRAAVGAPASSDRTRVFDRIFEFLDELEYAIGHKLAAG